MDEHPLEYFKKAMQFLKDFSWIYQYSNTRFILDGVFEQFPDDWKIFFSTISNEDLNTFTSPNILNQNIPETLRIFLIRLNGLKFQKNPLDFQGKEIYFKKMKPKKMHEISRLSNLISEMCQDKIDILIDFGSGLGYLSEILYQNCKCKIIGLESDTARVKTSNQRQKDLYPLSIGKVKYVSHMISENSENFITNCIKTEFPLLELPRLAIIGLHSCADLTVTSMKLFLKMVNVKVLIIMPCCYHKMRLESTGGENHFLNFPLSKSLSNVVRTEEQYRNIINRPFLRLACQQTVSKWSEMSSNDHREHGNEMFIRGVVECILSEDEVVIKNKNLENSNLYSSHTFSDMCNRYTLRSKINGNTKPWTENHKILYDKIVQKYPLGPKLAEALTCLQTSLQDLCENIVLYDRVCYMKEFALANDIKIDVTLEKIMNDKLSPRSHVLIAKKLIT